MIKKKKIPNDFEKSFQLYFQDIGKYSSLSLEQSQSIKVPPTFVLAPNSTGISTFIF